MGGTYDFIFKITLLGDYKVGKSSFFNRVFGHNTLGVPLSFHIMKISGLNVKFLVWDSPQQKFPHTEHSLARHIHHSHAVILVYDITNYFSFVYLEQRALPLITEHALQNVNLLFIGINPITNSGSGSNGDDVCPTTTSTTSTPTTTTTIRSTSPFDSFDSRSVTMDEVKKLAERFGFVDGNGNENGTAMFAEFSMMKDDGLQMFKNVFVPFAHQLTRNATIRPFTFLSRSYQPDSPSTPPSRHYFSSFSLISLSVVTLSIIFVFISGFLLNYTL